MLASKQQYLGTKYGNFSNVIKAKCFSFHELRKCVSSKEQHFVQFNGKIKLVWLSTFFSVSFFAEIRQDMTSNVAEIIQGLTAQAYRNSARLDVMYSV